ncbi:MAG: c-type cytochrome [Acidobacteriota bacterium]
MIRATALAVAALALAGCTSKRTPPIQVFPDMKDQPKYLPQSGSAFFADGRAERRPVPGTVARGFLKEDDAFYTGKQDGAFVNNPLPITRDTLARGQERFNIYCAPCHDQTGSGQGIVAQRATWPVFNITEPRIVEMKDGEIFDTITHGKRTMPGYRFQVAERDRWAIVAYVRALQRAARGTVADVPPELRSELR